MWPVLCGLDGPVVVFALFFNLRVAIFSATRTLHGGATEHRRCTWLWSVFTLSG
jgi:hypothetical protein